MTTPVPSQPPEEELLSLKVMRLKKPTFRSIMPIVCEKTDEIGGVPSAYRVFYPEKSFDALGFSQYMTLPDDFGRIFVGEDLKLYINMNNTSKYTFKNLVLKVELVKGKERKVIKDMGGEPIHQLLPHQCFETTIEQSLFENGLHIIVCNVTYRYVDSAKQLQRKVLRKIFKFTSEIPLKMKNLRIREYSNTTYYVSMEVKNQTNKIIFVKVKFVPSKFVEGFRGFYCNEDEATKFYNSMMKNETRRYLFKVTQKPNSLKKELGKIEFLWHWNFGEKGLLTTSPIYKTLKPIQMINIEIQEVPERIFLEEPFKLILEVVNNHTKTVCLSVKCRAEKMYPIIINGHSLKRLGNVKPGHSKKCVLSLVSLKSGIQSLSEGVEIIDSTNKVKYVLPRRELFVDIREEVDKIITVTSAEETILQI